MRHLPTTLMSKAIVFERAGLAGLVTLWFVAVYFGAGAATASRRPYALETSWDARIPFLAGWIWVYAWAFPCALAPVFLVRCPRLLRTTALAYMLAIGLAGLVFVAFPVTSTMLRPPASALDLTHSSGRMVARLYQLDTPRNLFPSLHLTLVALASYSVWRAHRPQGAAMFAGLAVSAVSVCAVKQHTLADVAGGLVLAVGTAALTLARWHPAPGMPAETGRGGTTWFLGVAALFYAGLCIAFAG